MKTIHAEEFERYVQEVHQMMAFGNCWTPTVKYRIVFAKPTEGWKK